MSKFVDGPRFRGGVEVKTPATTRKVKEKVLRSESVYDLVRYSLELLGCAAESHRLPKSFDKHTGEPKSYTWKVQPHKIEEVILLCGSEAVTPTCRAPVEIVKQLVDRINGESLVVRSEDNLGDVHRVLVSPYYYSSGDPYYVEPKIIGVEISLVKEMDICDFPA